jgi:hypothetical protein
MDNPVPEHYLHISTRYNHPTHLITRICHYRHNDTLDQSAAPTVQFYKIILSAQAFSQKIPSSSAFATNNAAIISPQQHA